MGMGRVLWGERRLFNGFMGGMRKGFVKGMVTGIFKVTVPILAWACFERDFFILLARLKRMPW
jgi:hypothetical protein